MKKALAVILLSTTIATPAFAGDSPFYAGALVGDQYLGILGGYQINKMYSVELSYAKILTPTTNTPGGSINTDHYNLGADLIVMLPWKINNVPDLSFFGKGGVEYVSTKVTTNVLGTSTSVSTNEVKLKLGGGAQYDVTSSFSARAGAGVIGNHKDLYISALYKF